MPPTAEAPHGPRRRDPTEAAKTTTDAALPQAQTELEKQTRKRENDRQQHRKGARRDRRKTNAPKAGQNTGPNPDRQNRTRCRRDPSPGRRTEKLTKKGQCPSQTPPRGPTRMPLCGTTRNPKARSPRMTKRKEGQARKKRLEKSHQKGRMERRNGDHLHTHTHHQTQKSQTQHAPPTNRDRKTSDARTAQNPPKAKATSDRRNGRTKQTGATKKEPKRDARHHQKKTPFPMAHPLRPTHPRSFTTDTAHPAERTKSPTAR